MKNCAEIVKCQNFKMVIESSHTLYIFFFKIFVNFVDEILVTFLSIIITVYTQTSFVPFQIHIITSNPLYFSECNRLSSKFIPSYIYLKSLIYAKDVALILCTWFDSPIFIYFEKIINLQNGQFLTLVKSCNFLNFQKMVNKIAFFIMSCHRW